MGWDEARHGLGPGAGVGTLACDGRGDTPRAVLARVTRNAAARSSGASSYGTGTTRGPAIAEIPGVGVLSATAAVAAMGDPSAFKSRREFAAWLGRCLGTKAPVGGCACLVSRSAGTRSCARSDSRSSVGVPNSKAAAPHEDRLRRGRAATGERGDGRTWRTQMSSHDLGREMGPMTTGVPRELRLSGGVPGLGRGPHGRLNRRRDGAAARADRCRSAADPRRLVEEFCRRIRSPTAGSRT